MAWRKGGRLSGARLNVPTTRAEVREMGWILVNILPPLTVPLLYMLGAMLVELSPEAKARARLLRAVQDGQLGWITMGFSASCAYDVITYVTDGKAHAVGWLMVVLTVSFGLLALSGFLAALGTMFPVSDILPAPMSARVWLRRYRMFVMTAICAALSATLYAVVHFLVQK